MMREAVLETSTDPTVLAALSLARNLDLNSRHTPTTVLVHALSILSDDASRAATERRTADVGLLADIMARVVDSLAR